MSKAGLLLAAFVLLAGMPHAGAAPPAATAAGTLAEAGRADLVQVASKKKRKAAKRRKHKHGGSVSQTAGAAGTGRVCRVVEKGTDSGHRRGVTGGGEPVACVGK